MELRRLYFFTATILNWQPLLMNREYKHILINSLLHLSKRKKIAVYAFVIMPNHIHLIWELLEENGKELPHASFLKFTSHTFLKILRIKQPDALASFKTESSTRKHQFWQRDALAIELYTPAVIYQKLNYIHNNPCQGKWMLAENPVEYPYSSAKFYEFGNDEFGFMQHIGERI